jgi:hypothetical protein
MSFDLLINSLRSRVRSHVMNKILHHYKLPTGRGWDGTAPKLEAFASESQENFQKIVETLNDVYLDHLITGDRSVHFFRENENIIKNMIAVFNSYSVPNSVFNTNYPYLLNEADLNNADRGVFLVDVKNVQKTQILIFCSKRSIRERVDIPPEGNLAEYSEVIGIKLHHKQSFDIIVLNPLTNTIEIRVDVDSNVPSDDRRVAFNQIKRKFQELVSELLRIDDYQLNDKVNLFSVIDKLYRSEEGRVCELAFTTDGTSSNKHEKMRRRHECLRKEEYHKGGFQAVEGRISIYRIAVTWEHVKEATLVTEPELLLPGSSRMLSSEEAILDEAIITDCAGIADYSFVINKLNSFLENEPNN